MHKAKRHFATIMALMIGLAAFMSLSAPVEAASKKYDLPSKVTNYKYKKGKWEKDSYSKLYYTKRGYLNEVKHSDGTHSKLKYSFYNNGKLRKITCPHGETIRFNKKGLMTKYCLSGGKVHEKFRYKGSDLSGSWESVGRRWEKYRYVKYSNGRINEIKNWNPYSSLDKEPDFITTFDKNGLITSEESTQYEYTTIYRYAFDKKGRIKSVTILDSRDNKTQKTYKYVFSYKNCRSIKNRDRLNTLINSNAGGFAVCSDVAAEGGYQHAIPFILPWF